MLIFTPKINNGMELIVDLISEEYCKLNEKLHKAPRGFGGDGHKWVDQVMFLIQRFGIETMLDYGCGQSTLWKMLRKRYPTIRNLVWYSEYDPCIKKKSKVPDRMCDLVVCTDVLEHIEPECLGNVIEHIKSLANRVVFLNINTQLANKVLPDGRNAHLIVQPKEWWREKLGHIFTAWRVKEMEGKRPNKDYTLFIQRTEK